MYCGSVFRGYVVPVAAPNEVTISLIYHGAFFVIMFIFWWTCHC